MKQEQIEDILDQCGKDCLLLFDGYDEYLKNKENSGWVVEVDQVIQREARKNFNLIVSTRPWNSEGLLYDRRLGFEKVSISQFNTAKRNEFIEKFFEHNPPQEEGEYLINALEMDSPDCVVPKEIAAAPRMLLYICNIWSNKNLERSVLKKKDKFWDKVWELMRHTFNRKYPTEKISQAGLAKIRRKLADFVLARENEEMSFDQFYEHFGEERGLDLFYFGVYSAIKERKTDPWEDEEKEEGKEEEEAVIPTYNVCIEDMLENECKEARQEKEEAQRKEEEAKKKGWLVQLVLVVLLLGLAVGFFAIWKK